MEMKRNMTYEIKTESREHGAKIILVLEALGYDVNPRLKKEHWKYFYFTAGNKRVEGRQDGRYVGVTVNDVLLFATRPEEVIEKVKLNDLYTAEVSSEETITVGCQTFTFDILEKLQKAVDKVKNA